MDSLEQHYEAPISPWRRIWPLLAFLPGLIWFSSIQFRTFYKSPEDHLIEAARDGSTEKVLALLEKGVDIDAGGDYSAMTPLMWAVNNRHPDVMELLLARGANLEARDSCGWTAIIQAASHGRTSAVEILFLNGAEVNARADNGVTALMKTAVGGHVATALVLLDMGADVNAADKSGETALMFATRCACGGVAKNTTQYSSADMAQTLIQNGADVSARDNYGRTPLIIASSAYLHVCEKKPRCGETEVLHTLLSSGADVNAKDRDGQTALMVAARDDCKNSAQALLENGADIDATDNEGNTALTYATTAHRLEVVKLLEEAIREESTVQ